MDPGFDPTRFLGIAKDLLSVCRSAGPAATWPRCARISPTRWPPPWKGTWHGCANEGRRNRVEQVTVDSIALTEAWQEYGRDLVTAEIRAASVDYVVDEATGQVVEGNATKPAPFVEYWTFVRPVGANPWRLGAIQQPSA